MLRLKGDSVQLSGLAPQMLLVVLVARDVYAEHEADCVITSANDSVHGPTSLHYAGCALDFRTKHLASPIVAEQVLKKIKERLNVDFDVLLESDHIHVEYQPRGRGKS